MNTFNLILKLLSHKKRMAYLVASISIIAAILETIGFSLILPILNSMFNQSDDFLTNSYFNVFDNIFPEDQKSSYYQ